MAVLAALFTTAADFSSYAAADSVKFLFFAGIEGSGHHAWRHMWRHNGLRVMKNANVAVQHIISHENDTSHDNNKTIYVTSTRLQHALSNGHEGRNNVFNPQTAGDLEKAIRVVEDEVRTFASQLKNKRVVVVINTAAGNMLSYPFGDVLHSGGGGGNKAIHMPNMEFLARVIDDVRGDLRVVVLLRDPALAVSSGIRRGYYHSGYHCGIAEGGDQDRARCEMEYVRLATQAQRLIFEQLHVLSKRSWACSTLAMPDDHAEVVRSRINEDLYAHLDVATNGLRMVTDDIIAKCPAHIRLGEINAISSWLFA